MAKQLGRAMLVKIGDGAGSEVFTTLCGLTSKTIAINNSEIDVTTADCDAPGGELWTEVLNGLKRVNISGTGLFKSAADEARLLTIAMSATAIGNFQVIIPELGTFAGAFHVSASEFGGEQEGALTKGMTLASSGPVTFTPAA